MTLKEYIKTHNKNTVMIALEIDNHEPIQYNSWNWLDSSNQLHLLNDDFSIGHIIHNGEIDVLEDQSIVLCSSFKPISCKLNFYFGGVTQ